MIVIAIANTITASESARRGRSASMPSRRLVDSPSAALPRPAARPVEQRGRDEERRCVDREERARPGRTAASAPRAPSRRPRAPAPSRARARSPAARSAARRRSGSSRRRPARSSSSRASSTNAPTMSAHSGRPPESPAIASGISVAARTTSAPIISLRRLQRSAAMPPCSAEEERGDAVGEPHGDDAERAARVEREPHQRDVAERVADLARRDREVERAEVAAPQQRRATSSRGPLVSSTSRGTSKTGSDTRSSLPAAAARLRRTWPRRSSAAAATRRSVTTWRSSPTTTRATRSRSARRSSAPRRASPTSRSRRRPRRRARRKSRLRARAAPPSWHRSLKRGGIFGGLIFILVVFVMPSSGIARRARSRWASFYAVAFIPLTYWIDRLTYRTWQRRQAKTQ